MAGIAGRACSAGRVSAGRAGHAGRASSAGRAGAGRAGIAGRAGRAGLVLQVGLVVQGWYCR